MLKTLLYFCLLMVSICQAPLCASSQEIAFTSVECSPQLQQAVNKIMQISEARSLINTIQQEGPIRIIANTHPLSEQFGAYWDLGKRTICINLSHCRSEGKVIGSIVFELHNAAANSKLQHFDHLALTKNIDRESYVKGVEYVEYENSLKASHLTKVGIQMGIFPADAYLPIYRNFEEHYHFQIIGGHSAWIGSNYDGLSNHKCSCHSTT